MPEGIGYGPNDRMNFGASPYAYADEQAAASAEPSPVPASGPLTQQLQAGLSRLSPQEIAMLDQAITPEIHMILQKIEPSLGDFLAPFAVNDADSPENAMMALEQQAAQQAAQQPAGPAPMAAPAADPAGGQPARRPNPLANIRAA